MRSSLSDTVLDRRCDLIALTQALIRCPTLNPPGAGYREICEHIAARLAPRGFETHLIRARDTPGDSDRYPRWNLVARRAGRTPGPCVHFNGHIDVVEVGHGWTRDPFGAAVEGDRIYGRGACDMKGGIAAAIVAAEAFVDAHPDHAGSIEFSATADEESGGYGGVAYLAEQGWFDPSRVDHVIIPEPLGHDRICLGHRGGWWAEIETHGEIAHGSMPFLGDCAVRHMGAVLHALETEIFPRLAHRRTAMPVVPDGARTATLNINAIHGGEPAQALDYTGLPSACVPDSCRIVLDRRYLIEESLESVRAEITDMLERLRADRPRFAYTLREINHIVPSMTAQDAPVVTTVAQAIRDTLGRDPAYVASPGSYDQKHIDRIGRLKNCIAYGPGQLELAHKPDEWVGITAMLDSAQVMARTLAALLVPPA